MAKRNIRVLLIAFVMSLATHTLYGVLDHNHYAIDTPSYLIPADNLVKGHGYVNAQNGPELRRTPGYPLLLALFSTAPLKLDYLIIAQHAFCILLVIGVAAFGFQITGCTVLVLVAAAVLSLDLATLRIANMFMTEIAATVLISLIVWTMYLSLMRERGRSLACVIAGFLGGCSVLVRPVGIFYFIPLVLCLFIAFKRRALKPAFLLTVSFLLLPGLWSMRNFSEGKYFGISTIGSENLLYYRAAGAVGIQQPGDYLSNVVTVRNHLIDATCSDLRAIYKKECSDITEAQRASYATHKGIDILSRNRWGYFRSVSRALVYMIFGGGAEALSGISHINPVTAERIVLLCTVPCAFLAFIGCWYWYQWDRNLFFLLIFSVGYFLLISAGAEAYSRFRVPVMPLYALLVGGGVAQVLGKISGNRLRFSKLNDQ